MTTVKDQRGSEILDRGECLRLLDQHSGGVGRVGFESGNLPTILPVNYVMDGLDIVFRTGAGIKFEAVQQENVIAFEIDEVDPDSGDCWSVLVRGLPSYLPSTGAVVDSVRHDGAVAPTRPQPSVMVPGSYLVKIRSTVVTGRRFKLAKVRAGV